MPRRRPRQEPAAFDRRLMEQQMQAITRLLESHDFASLDEANAFIQGQLASGQPLAAPPATPLEEAQELVYQALETTGPRRLQLEPGLHLLRRPLAQPQTQARTDRRLERVPGASIEDAGGFELVRWPA